VNVAIEPSNHLLNRRRRGLGLLILLLIPVPLLLLVLILLIPVLLILIVGPRRARCLSGLLFPITTRLEQLLLALVLLLKSLLFGLALLRVALCLLVLLLQTLQTITLRVLASLKLLLLGLILPVYFFRRRHRTVIRRPLPLALAIRLWWRLLGLPRGLSRLALGWLLRPLHLLPAS